MIKYFYCVVKPLLFIALTCLSSGLLAKTNQYHDYQAAQSTSDILQMQDFHLHNAEDKILHGQLAYAWGDLAFVLCNVPNHHVALQHMLELAPQLHKEAELVKFFENAKTAYPQDTVLNDMYQEFLNKQVVTVR
jgi:hypothetical protein